MKTIAKSLIAASILMLSFNSYASTIGTPRLNQITYQVQIIAQNPHISNLKLNLYVGMTDENGRVIGRFQQCKPGTSTYYFFENGPVDGTRVAQLYDVSNNSSTIPYFYCAPDSQTGKFNPGSSYIFDLYPGINISK